MADETTTTESAPIEPPPLPTVTPASEWKKRARAVYTLRLPSGFVCKAKRPDFMRSAINGELDLDALMMAQNQGGMDAVKAAVTLFPKLLPHVMIEPRISAEASDDSLTLNDVSEIDKFALFAWASGRATVGIEELAVE